MNTQTRDIYSALGNFLNEETPSFLFAGAGVSSRAGLPTWNEYLRQLAEFARIHDPLARHHMIELLNEGDYLTAAELYFLSKKIAEPERFEHLAAPLTDYDCSKLVALAKLPFSSIVTTNFDRSLLDAYARVQKVAAEEVNLDDPTLAAAPFNKRFYIARIHGRVEVPPTIHLGERHYEALGGNSHYIDFLAHLFTRTRLLFVGFSFLDPAIRNVLEIVQKKVGAFHSGRHLALLPRAADDEFNRKLEQFSIRKIIYDPADHHGQLWECFEQLGSMSRGGALPQVDTDEHDPLALTKKYLSACYARVSLGARVVPLRKAVIEGIVSTLIADAGQSGLEQAKIVQAVARQLTLTLSDSEPLVESAIASLLQDSHVQRRRLAEKHVLVVSEYSDGEAFESGLGALVAGAANRFVVRSAGNDSAEIRRCICDLIQYVISHRGWDLGAAFASGVVPSNMEVSAMMKAVPTCATQLRGTDVVGLSRAVEDLLRNSNAKEAGILADFGRASFALELVNRAAHDTLFQSLTLPERIYIDANVLMPAFAPGHPYCEVYQSTIARLVDAAASALMPVEIIAYRGYLEEVVNHRRLAIEEMELLNKGSIDALRKDALLYGTVNMNVYIGAYANALASEKELTFEEYLRRNAPYTSESELARWLEDRGISVRRDTELKAGSDELPVILHTLEKANADGRWNRKGRWSRKEGILILYDAVQLAALARDLKAGRRIVFVSADRRLRDNVSVGAISHLANAMISHVGLAQLVDLLVGTERASRGLAKLMWNAKISNETEQIRNYLVDLALDQYDEGYAMEMGKVVDYIAEDAVIELNRCGLNVNAKDPVERVRAMKVLEGFEEMFFEGMRQAIERKKGD